MSRQNANDEILEALRLMDLMLGCPRVQGCIRHNDREDLTELIGKEALTTTQRNRVHQLWARYGPVYEGTDNGPGDRPAPAPMQVSRWKTKVWA